MTYWWQTSSMAPYPGSASIMWLLAKRQASPYRWIPFSRTALANPTAISAGSSQAAGVDAE